ncbi:hypothetical protein GOV13_01200 [Candidatus Pacearchaeota archaeon]|nr:hypothetical protein [Candidatus Pacearchaeota archaeon]
MTTNLIDKTDRYIFEKIKRTENFRGKNEMASKLSTTFVHEGNINLYLQVAGSEIHKRIKTGDGFIIAPGTTYRIDSSGGLVAYTVSSEVQPGSPIIEIMETGNNRKEIELGGYRIIEDPKRVDKPWGHELWISWFRDHHVMKQIGMKPEKQSSLQFHREKLETNYLHEGSAEVIDGYKLDSQASEEEVQKSSKGVDFNKYKQSMGPGDFWTSHPGVVHRVISGPKGYLAYEVSTSELDDVIRLQDDSGRGSGRINSEHLKEEEK